MGCMGHRGGWPHARVQGCSIPQRVEPALHRRTWGWVAGCKRSARPDARASDGSAWKPTAGTLPYAGCSPLKLQCSPEWRCAKPQPGEIQSSEAPLPRPRDHSIRPCQHRTWGRRPLRRALHCSSASWPSESGSGRALKKASAQRSVARARGWRAHPTYAMPLAWRWVRPGGGQRSQVQRCCASPRSTCPPTSPCVRLAARADAMLVTKLANSDSLHRLEAPNSAALPSATASVPLAGLAGQTRRASIVPSASPDRPGPDRKGYRAALLVLRMLKHRRPSVHEDSPMQAASRA
eukprot:scaffold17777_cov136-Isochrysis_galbana.AAC.2